MPGGPSIPVPTTGRTQRAPTSTKATRSRIESGETATKRLQANRKAQPTLLHQLSNTGPMSQVADGQTLVYDAASGQYVPADLPAGFTPYASLTGAGETNPFGKLTQAGELEVDAPFVVLDSTGGGINMETSGSFFAQGEGITLQSGNSMLLEFPSSTDFTIKGGSTNLLAFDWGGTEWDLSIFGIGSMAVLGDGIFEAIMTNTSTGGGSSVAAGQGFALIRDSGPSSHLFVGAVRVIGYDPAGNSGIMQLDATGTASSSVPINFVTAASTLLLPALSFPAPTFGFSSDGHISFNSGGGWSVLV
jgi:hypothetical protein